MILYFTGTGNSKYVADALAHQCGDEVVNANRYIKAGKVGSFHSERPYVFVFPVYLSTIPEVFRNFIKRSKFRGNKDAYFVPTCASASGSVPNAAMDLCKATGYFRYRGCHKVEMPQNYVAYFTMFDEDRIDIRLKEAERTIQKVSRAIVLGKSLPDKPASKVEYLGTKWVEKWYNTSFTRTSAFYVTDSCIGCSLCAKSCSVNAISMTSGKPVWIHKTCVHCMACINRCPKKAIQYSKRTVDKSRYVCKPYSKPHKEKQS